MTVLFYFERPFLLIATSFDILIKKTLSLPTLLSKLLVFFINMIFNLFISLFLGGFLSIILLALLMIIRQNHFTPNAAILMSIPLFLFAIFSCIIFLNWEDRHFSLPRCIFIFYGILITSESKKHLYQTVLFLVLVTVLLTTILIFPSYYIFHPSKENALSTVIIVFLIALFISILLYSYATMDNLKRVRRQFLLWFIILIGVLFLSAYQLKINLNEPLTNQIHIGSGLLILSFVYSMITVSEKGIELFKLLSNNYSQVLSDIWSDYTSISKHNFKEIQNKMVRTKYIFSLELELVYLLWRTGANLNIILILLKKIIFMIMLGLLIFIISSNYDLIRNISSNFDLQFTFIPGEKKQFILFLMITLLLLGWNILSVRSLDISKWINKVHILGRLLISLVISLTLLVQTDIGNTKMVSQMLYYTILVLGILMVITLLTNGINKILKWLKS